MERDPHGMAYRGYSENFNSHAHVERDRNVSAIEDIKAISTHTLTWSVTKEMPVYANVPVISTHTLTWSVTCIRLACL